MKKYHILLSWLILVFLSVSAEAAVSIQAPDSTSRGPHPVASGEYRFPAAIDADVLPDRPTEIWAKVFWPRDADLNAPLIVMLHGNHSTCGFGTRPRHDNNDEYTDTGKCPEGYVVVPNHEGYNYLAENLASWGYWVVSINTNRGINGAMGTNDDPALIAARGRMVLKHLYLLYQWSNVGGAPESLGLGKQGLVGKIDFTRVGLFGHSRGGQGVRAAYNFYLDQNSSWQQKIPGLRIKGIYEIGATDIPMGDPDTWEKNPVFIDANGTAWNQLLPMCDADVTDAQGRLPFERMLVNHSESSTIPKSLYEVWGANHNFFNTEWQESDMADVCPDRRKIFDPKTYESVQQQTVALASVPAFFRSHLAAQQDGAYKLNFNPLAELPDIVNNIIQVDRDFVPTLEATKSAIVDNFDLETGINSSGNNNLAQNVEIKHRFLDEETPVRASNQRIAAVTWNTAGPGTFFESVWSLPQQGRNVSDYSTLDFRIARADSKLNVDHWSEFGIALEDATGKLSNIVSIDDYTLVNGPTSYDPNAGNTGEGPEGAYNPVMKTVRIPLGDFRGIDLTRVHGVRFIFNETMSGAIYLANIRFQTNNGLDSAPDTTMRAKKMSLRNQLHEGIARQQVIKPVIVPENMNSIKSIRFASNNARTASLTRPAIPPVIEMRLASQVAFPVTDALPTLNIGKQKFVLSRYSDPAQKEMTFILTEEQYHNLDKSSEISLTNGKVWKFGTLSKWLLKHSLS